ncbi:MAG: hypothetical protein HPY83_17060 [Anaerolineae bacterium]|nr:hypothetical protein [Anaerolineae bacterium]
MTPEQRARQNIDGLLEAAGWVVQNLSALDLSARRGVAVREFPLSTGTADYLLFVDRKAVGVLEAKPEGTTLSGVAEQSSTYEAGISDHVPHVREPLPFVYESTGVETYCRGGRDSEVLAAKISEDREAAPDQCRALWEEAGAQ